MTEFQRLMLTLSQGSMTKPNYIRLGQYYFNKVHELYPELANSIRATDADPFYDDRKNGAFFEAIEQYFDTIEQEEKQENSCAHEWAYDDDRIYCCWCDTEYIDG